MRINYFVFVFVHGTWHSGRGEVAWSVPDEAVLSSSRGTSFVQLNQSRNILPYNQQMGGAHGHIGVCTAAFLKPSSNVHYIQSSISDGYPAPVDAGCTGVHVASEFSSTPGSQTLNTAQGMDHRLSAIALRSQQAVGSKPDYFASYSPISGTTPGTYETSVGEVHCLSHLPAHGWGSGATVLGSTYAPATTSWQNVPRQQADIELTSTASSVYSAAAQRTGSFSALQTSMQYCAVDSPVAASTAAGVSSTVNSPYAPGKTYTDGSGSQRSVQLQQQQYIERLLQLHYLLLASNKLQATAPRYPASHHFDTPYIPRGMASSVARPTPFDAGHLQSLSPRSLQPGFTVAAAAARFPRSAQH